MRDKRTPLWLRVFGYLMIAYALSPIDLIPDFFPFIGYLDELILLSAGLWILIKLMPDGVLADARSKAQVRIASGGKYPHSIVGACLVIAIWVMIGWWLWSLLTAQAHARTLFDASRYTVVLACPSATHRQDPRRSVFGSESSGDIGTRNQALQKRTDFFRIARSAHRWQTLPDTPAI